MKVERPATTRPADTDPGRRRILTASALALAAVAAARKAGAQGANTAAGKRYQAIVHVTDGEPEKWGRVLSYIQGLESTPDSADLAIALMVQGLASDMLKADAPIAKGVSAAIARGIEVIACEYSLKVRRIARTELNPDVARFVPFGGMEIVKRQGSGWAYLRP